MNDELPELIAYLERLADEHEEGAIRRAAVLLKLYDEQNLALRVELDSLRQQLKQVRWELSHLAMGSVSLSPRSNGGNQRA